MPRPSPTDKLDEIERVVKAHPNGLSAPEIAVLAMHEGNFARYSLRPAEFQAWQTAWEPT